MAETHVKQPNYVGVFIILAVLTLIEIGVSVYVNLPLALRPPVLLALAVVKASLVALYYMHLRFDRRIFAALFVVPVLAAAAFIFAITR